ncbi:hypothetical protein WN943_003582 [Citrus x changshan-huyou]
MDLDLVFGSNPSHLDQFFQLSDEHFTKEVDVTMEKWSLFNTITRALIASTFMTWQGSPPPLSPSTRSKWLNSVRSTSVLTNGRLKKKELVDKLNLQRRSTMSNRLAQLYIFPHWRFGRKIPTLRPPT